MLDRTRYRASVSSDVRPRNMMRYTTVTAFLALCTLAGCNEPEAKSAIVDLQVSDYAALGSAVPHLVEHGGQLHSFWRGHAEKPTKGINGLPVIRAELMRGSWKAGWNTVAYASRLDAGTWSDAARLADGDVKCDPKFVWSDARGLNLLVDLGDSTCSHLLMIDGQMRWQEIRHFPELKEGIFVPLGIQQVGDSLHVTTFSQKQLCYWRYDGRDWHGPVVIENEVKFDGTYGYFRPRLAVADSGEIHVVWNTQTNPSHVVIRDDKIVSTRSIQLSPRASKGDDIDIEALTDGRLILAYQVAEGEPEAGKEAIYTSRFIEGRWGEASAGPSGGGSVLGDPQLIARNGQALLVWRHRGETHQGGFVASGPTASFSIQDRKGSWTPSAIIKPISTDPNEGLGGSPTFYSLYSTKDGNTYITWGDDSVFVMALPKLGAEPTKVEQDGAEQPATAPESTPESNQKPQPESEARSQ